MSLLEQRLILSPGDDVGKTTTFIAEICSPRPGFDEVVDVAARWSQWATQYMRVALARRNCAVKWMQVVADDQGIVMIVLFSKPVILGQAKTAAAAILGFMPPAQLKKVEQNLRSLDEVDRRRIESWSTLGEMWQSYAQACAEQARDAEVVETPVIVAEFLPPLPEKEREKRSADAAAAEAALPPQRARTVAEFLADDAAERAPPPMPATPPRLMLADLQNIAEPRLGGDRLMLADVQNIAEPSDMSWAWELRVKEEGIMVLAEVGSRPDLIDGLVYIKCRLEARRELLLLLLIEDSRQPGYKIDMVWVVRVAMSAATEGILPGPGDHGRRDHGRRLEFVRRCAAALKEVDEFCTSDLQQLTPEQQSEIRHALAGTAAPAPYQGCLTMDCLDQDTNWEVRDLALPGESPMPMSRCSRCGQPKAVGRTVNSIRDILSLMERRAHGSFFARVAANYRVDLRDHDRV